MKCTKTKFDGVLVIDPRAIEDNRGFFMEVYLKDKFLTRPARAFLAHLDKMSDRG